MVRRLRRAIERRGALWAAWRRLAWPERALFLRVACLIPTMAVLVRTVGFYRTRGWLDAAAARRVRDDRDTSPAVPPLMRALARARRYAPYRGNCLSQSLTLWSLLRRRGVDATLCLGVRFDDGALAAHAWVESDGMTVNDTPDVRDRFTPFQALDFRRAPTWS